MARMDRIFPLRNTIRDYPWGSRSAIAALQGRPTPSPGPEAELWMGAHASAPSLVVTGEGEVPLDRWIERDPEAVLGSGGAARFRGQLPFLLKLLAAEQPLSIQVHPGAAQAQEGFARENAAGIPLDAPQRCYRDPNPKAELICALGNFEALCGFRPVDEILAGLEALRVPALRDPLEALRGADPRAGLARLFEAVMRGTPEERRVLSGQVVAAASAGRGEPGPLALVAELGRLHPGDSGALVPLLLNRIELAPGEALFLAPGELHTYVRGVGIELMTSSDNVLRAGLTPKHVDLRELLGALRFETQRPRVLLPEERAAGELCYATPAEEFELSVLRIAPGRPHSGRLPGSFQILLCTAGEVRVDDGREALVLRRGGSLVVPAAASRCHIEGQATLYRAAIPEAA